MAGRPGSRRIDQRNAQCLGELGGERTGALAGGVSCEIRLRQEMKAAPAANRPVAKPPNHPPGTNSQPSTSRRTTNGVRLGWSTEATAIENGGEV